MTPSFDPLFRLPIELVLRILEFACAASLAQLTQVSKDWHHCIDVEHQDSIYYPRVDQRNWSRELSSSSIRRSYTSYADYFDNTHTWKELCKRQALLKRAWSSQTPVTAESVLQIGDSPVWRFRPDFTRRFFLSTSQGGGLSVTDFETGHLLWHLSVNEVRQYAHLEYSDGIAVFDKKGNAIEVWKVCDEVEDRGKLRKLGELHHDVDTRGFMLRDRTLCVVSTEEVAFVYDVFEDRVPSLRLTLDIADGAIGHLDQNENNVMFSLGDKGYHFYSKNSGQFLGVLQPRLSVHFYHIKHPARMSESRRPSESHGPSKIPFPPQSPRTDRLTRLKLEAGIHQERLTTLCLEHDEWGAGMLEGNMMVGVSRGGRVFICSDYKGALRSAEIATRTSAIIECETGGEHFDLGGWLSVRGSRVLFEVNEKIYIMELDLDSGLPRADELQRPIFALATASAPQFSIPVSWMGVYDDNIMNTYTTFGIRQRTSPGVENDTSFPQQSRVFPTKAIRVLSLLPDPANIKASVAHGGQTVRTGSKRRASAASNDFHRRPDSPAEHHHDDMFESWSPLEVYESDSSD